MKLIDIQLENEKLRKQIEELSTSLKNNNNNNIYGNEVLLKDNIISGNGNNNNDLINKIKELNLENQKYKENISKLENDINKKNEELEGFKNVIFKQQNQLEKKDDEFQKQKDELIRNISSLSILGNEGKIINTEPNRNKSNMKQNQNKSFEAQKDSNAVVINNLLNKLKDADRKINSLKDKNKELKYKLEDKQAERELSGYRTEDINFSNYEEEFDLKRMVNGARDKNRSEDINIDYPGIQILKDKYREVIQNMSMLEEQVKILLCNISCNNKIKPQITQICQLMRIPAKNIQLVIAGKDKRRALGLIS
jgi:chromosome segregation ATPase